MAPVLCLRCGVEFGIPLPYYRMSDPNGRPGNDYPYADGRNYLLNPGSELSRRRFFFHLYFFFFHLFLTLFCTHFRFYGYFFSLQVVWFAGRRNVC